MNNKGCISCVYCKVIRNHYFCGSTRLTEKQVFNSKGYCSNFKNKKSIEQVSEAQSFRLRTLPS